jgi:hypothetical protein
MSVDKMYLDKMSVDKMAFCPCFFCSIVLHKGPILQNFILVNYNKSYFCPLLIFTNKGGVYLSGAPTDAIH